MKRFYIQFPLAGGWFIGGTVYAMDAVDAVQAARSRIAEIGPQWVDVTLKVDSDPEITPVPDFQQPI